MCKGTTVVISTKNRRSYNLTMEWSRRYKKAWAKHTRKSNEHHNNVQLNSLCDYLSSYEMMRNITNRMHNAYI